MTREEITEVVKDILNQQIGADTPAMVDDAVLTDLGADSLDLVEITMEIENRFNLEISDEDADKISTVGQIVDYLVSKDV